MYVMLGFENNVLRRCLGPKILLNVGGNMITYVITYNIPGGR